MEGALRGAWDDVLGVLTSVDDYDLAETSPTGETLLQLACAANAIAVVRHLCTHPRCHEVVNAARNDTRPALLSAVLAGATEIVSMLLATFGEDLDLNVSHSGPFEDAEQWPLMAAIDTKHVKIALLLLDQPSIDINRRRATDSTAYYVACILDLVPVVERMLALPALTRDVMTKRGSTPFTGACRRAAWSTARVLLREHAIADINAQDPEGRTGFLWTCYHGNLDLVEVLLEVVDVTRACHRHWTALDYLSRNLVCDEAHDNDRLINLVQRLLARGVTFGVRTQPMVYRQPRRDADVDLAELASRQQLDELYNVLRDGAYTGNVNRLFEVEYC
ncbi:hypothetical protein SDRG_02393 [Saprolegnia diclina VS20]|uniref:Uncharacterized protein n=1 Tax=Saprolegnia diclina (strain VS20) TaxID=1156394 RepID=T0SCH5_SAPDV|nr:hypothetical protein SDRG_02393 [Saprolegnia diclina VS20]EQC40502.1 hypothetical protein SDRG_02393 [Saprolegnia diclina VS20]|eukprot:XP_008606201.1 hypothetical protein SDRG_02393 [Saprolegnia diclina VS20]